MKPQKSFNTLALLLMGSALALGACSMEMQPASGSPEALLEAEEGDWALVEDEQLPDPAQKHMSTRKQVSPTDMSSKRSYTQDARTAKFDEDVHFRVLRLERQMNALQGDFDKILPPLADKAEADQRLSMAAQQVQASRTAPAPKPPVKVVEEVKIDPAPVQAPAPKPIEKVVQSVTTTGPAQVTKLRLGEHPGKTRLVLDLNKASSFTADLDTSENLLVVEINGADWGAPMKQSFANHPLIKSYAAEKTDAGSRLILSLAKPAKITSKMSLPPNSTYPSHRIVLDLSAQ